MPENCDELYNKHCKDKFEQQENVSRVLFKKIEEIVLKLDEMNNRLYKDNGHKSIQSEIQAAKEAARILNDHLAAHKAATRDIKEIAYDILKKLIWAACILAAGYFMAK